MLEKVDTLKNIENSLTKFVSIKKSTRCTKVIDITILLQGTEVMDMFMKRRQQVGQCWVILYSFHDINGLVDG